MKKILGLDLGTNSIGWAFVNEAENAEEESKIVRLGVRVNPLTTDEIKNFTEGKSITTNAERTQKRHARRNLDRYQLRREQLIKVFNEERWINNDTKLNEDGKETFNTLRLRAEAVDKKVTFEELLRVLLSINKKRGYKSSRKAKNEDESGQIINEIDIALKLRKEGQTPGKYAFDLLQAGKQVLPNFYRSDLIEEFSKIWKLHQEEYPEILTEEFKHQIIGKSKTATTKTFYAKHKIDTAKNNAKDKKLQAYEWRMKAANEICPLDICTFALAEVNGNIASSSGYLGAIGDRSKILHLENLTVGQYLYDQIKNNPHKSLKNQIFYRQDYMDEFDKIWQQQSLHHPTLNEVLKQKIRNEIIFYQRPLKSQKSLISFCEFESKEVEKVIDDKVKKVTIGSKVTPRSSCLFQHFKIWSILANIEIKTVDGPKRKLDDEEKDQLFTYLNCNNSITGKQALNVLFGKEAKKWEINYKSLDGNKTNAAFLEAYQRIFEFDGNEVNFKGKSPEEIYQIIDDFFKASGIDRTLVYFDSELSDKEMQKQSQYQLWHLLYSYEGDKSRSGIDSLLKILQNKFGFSTPHAAIIANVPLIQDYGQVSAKAIRKIIPFLKDNTYDKACQLAGYNHSSSLTKEENLKRQLFDKLEILPKNSLRNPVVEKILNQMIHIVNGIISHPDMGKPDEIRIELARELKKSAKEREEMVENINTATKYHEKIREILREEPFNIKNPTRNDIIKYKLYEELSFNGYKDFYTNTKIDSWDLFSPRYDIEHIIPKAVLFDDSFSNKTLCPRDFNNNVKGDMTAYDCIAQKQSDHLQEYLSRITDAFESKKISKAKFEKLKKKREDIGEGFIERDLRNSQYIARKAQQILMSVSRTVTPTTGRITDYLRSDWGLINVMKEINLPKYRALGLTKKLERKNGNVIEMIEDWTKRNDHRHHAIDALTVAFTKPAYIQYLNNLNARSDKGSSIWAIEQKYIEKINGGRKFIPPLPHFRSEAKRHIESILVSIKAKNKVVTKNINKTKKKGGFNTQITLTPRGQLHKETVYGNSLEYVTKLERVNANFDKEKIESVAKKSYREALLDRLTKYGNNPKIAFSGKNSLAKNPIFTTSGKQLPEIIKTVKQQGVYTIRKEISPDLRIDKVVDKGVKEILQKRLDEFGGKNKEAFSNLDEKPIWIKKDKGISLKRVTISGVSNAEALHSKQDHFGTPILLKGKEIANDYVSTGNNHHVAIYKDDKGKFQEQVVSFYEAVARKVSGLSIIDKDYKKDDGWEFLFDLKQNDMFVFPSEEFNPRGINLLDNCNNNKISPNLFRVQKISTNNYLFNHHLNSTAITGDNLKNKSIAGILYHFIQTPSKLNDIVKVRINHLGEVVHVDN